MQEEMQTEDEISLSDIFRALWSKIWIIIASLLAGVILGGVFGFVKYHDVHYYGADVQYFVSSLTKDEDGEWQGGITQSYNENVLKQVQGHLASESFSRILMEDLPEAKDITKNSKEEEKFFDLLSKSVNYSYTVGPNFVNVKVSVLNNPELAEHLLEQIKAKLPDFISEKMSNTVFGKTTCEQMNFRLSGLLNEGQTTKEMIKFGLIIGLVAAIVACVAVVVTDRTDTRLRDYEDIPRKFNLPVLGVVPRIETLAQEDRDNNKNVRKGAEK